MRSQESPRLTTACRPCGRAAVAPWTPWAAQIQITDDLKRQEEIDVWVRVCCVYVRPSPCGTGRVLVALTQCLWQMTNLVVPGLA
jgi:hypothetical protein